MPYLQTSAAVAAGLALVGATAQAVAAPPAGVSASRPLQLQLVAGGWLGAHRGGFACPGGYAPDAVVFSGAGAAGVLPSRAEGSGCGPAVASAAPDPSRSAAPGAYVFETRALRGTLPSGGGWSLGLTAQPSATPVVVAVQDVGPQSIELVSIKQVRLLPATGKATDRPGPYRVELDGAEHAFPAGHRIRLSILATAGRTHTGELTIMGAASLTPLPATADQTHRLALGGQPRP